MSTDLYSALVAAQAEFKDPTKDATNPHFRSRFVTLKGVLDAVRPALRKHGLALVQEIDFEDGTTFVRTRLLHQSGGSIESRCPVIAAKERDPQAMGSAITYARRYAAAAICGIAPSDDDDDGEAAAAPPKPRQQPKTAPKADKAEGFATVEEAVAAIDAAKSALSLDVIAHRIQASGFQGQDLEEARRAFGERKALMQGQGAA